jgi:hypothetical protein
MALALIGSERQIPDIRSCTAAPLITLSSPSAVINSPTTSVIGFPLDNEPDEHTLRNL